MPSSMINHRLIVRVLLSVVTTGTIILNSSRYHGKMYFVDALLTSASSSSFVASSRSSTAAAVSPGALSFVCNVEFKRSAPNCRRNECSFTRLHATPPSQRRVARRDLKKRPNRRGRRTGASVPSSSTSTTTTSSSSSSSKNLNPVSSFLSNNNVNKQNQQLIVESEMRPLVRAKKIEAGEDYWIDEKDLQKNIQRQIAIKNRKLQEGEIPKEKLRVEVVAPYKQNWIGLFSVGVIVLATIIRNFPELLNSPVIQIPDL